jgi:outer membrane lipoprotein-sorting protein
MQILVKYIMIVFMFPVLAVAQPDSIDAETILERIDENMSSRNRVVESDMVIQGRRKSRTITSKSYAEGDYKSLTEYLAPEREEGTKMLKLEDRLWIYSPSSDRTLQISGHMLKQSVMGSDLSYEDMMEDRKLTEIYDAKVISEVDYEGRLCWVVEMNAKVDDLSYEKRKVWVDQDRFVPLKEELFAKSGQLLKKTTLSDVRKIDNRWFPMKINYKDMLKDGNGTDYIIKEIQFDIDLPSHIFTKASLSK